MNAPASYPTSVGGATCSTEDPTQTRELLALSKREIRKVMLMHGQRAHIHLGKGAAWITMEGDREDYALIAGEQVHFVGPGLLVLEALEDETEACFRSSPS